MVLVEEERQRGEKAMERVVEQERSQCKVSSTSSLLPLLIVGLFHEVMVRHFASYPIHLAIFIISTIAPVHSAV